MPEMVENKEPYGVVLVIIDGISDVMPSVLGGRTPMQVANMPTLDALTVRGRTGLMDPVRPGLACGSDTAHLSMFGYDSERVYRGRGAFETIGSGISMLPGDVAFKCNFARMHSTSDIVEARCAGSGTGFTEYCRSLCESLNDIAIPGHDDVRVSVKHAGAHRLVVCLRSLEIPLSDRITSTDPLVDNRPLLKSMPFDDGVYMPNAHRTASIVNSLSCIFQSAIGSHNYTVRRREMGLPFASVVLLRGPAEQIDVPSFAELHNVGTFLIAPTKIIAGIGATAGIDIVHAPGATGNFDTDLLSKAHTCVEKMATQIVDENSLKFKYDLGIIHVKAVDEAGHHQNVHKKVVWFEKVDEMIAVLIDDFKRSSRRKNIILAVTGDHTTIAEYGDHTCDPVPVLFTDISPLISQSPFSRITPDKATRFDEIDIGTNGSIGRFKGRQLMTLVTNLIASSVPKS